jgi:hypothetical protein
MLETAAGVAELSFPDWKSSLPEQADVKATTTKAQSARE